MTGSWYLPPEILMMGLPVLVMAMSWRFRDWTRGTEVFANWVPDLASCLCRAMLLAIWLIFAWNEGIYRLYSPNGQQCEVQPDFRDLLAEGAHGLVRQQTASLAPASSCVSSKRH